MVESAGDFVAAHHIGWYNCFRPVTVHKLLIRGEYHARRSGQYKLSRVPKFSIFESPVKNTVCIGCCFQMFLRGLDTSKTVENNNFSNLEGKQSV